MGKRLLILHIFHGSDPDFLRERGVPVNLIGLDIGTTSISAAVLDAENGVTGKTWTIANDSFLPAGNSWERIQDPEKIIRATVLLLEECLESFPEPAVIGLTGQMHGIVYVNAAGESVSPLYTWQDGRGNAAGADGQSLCSELHETYGLPFYAGYGLVTHLYNLRHHLVPEDAVTFCTIMDFLGMALTGRKSPLVHSSNAAGFGFYDAASLCFRTDVLEKEGVPASFLPETTPSVALLGSFRGIPVSIALGDNQASFLGSVRKADRQILVNMGTGGQVSLLTDHVITGEDIETRPFIDDSYLIVGPSLCGGRAYAALAAFFGAVAAAAGVKDFDPYAVMDGLLSSYSNPDRLKVTTTFSGTRDHPERRGSVENLSTENFDPASLTYGVLDGIAQELYDRYLAMGVKKSSIVASGNGMRRNRHLQAITAEKFGMELELSTLTEEAACGAAIAGGSAVGSRTWQQAVGI